MLVTCTAKEDMKESTQYLSSPHIFTKVLISNKLNEAIMSTHHVFAEVQALRNRCPTKLYQIIVAMAS
jgi:hypothetical protein